jgi:hypothetical protein
LKGTNILVYGVQNRLEKLLNDSNDSHEDKINKLEKKLSKDFQLKLDESNKINKNKIKELENQLNDSNNLNKIKINDFHKSNELNQKRMKELEKQLNDSNDSHEDKINKLEIKLSKDFQLKLDELKTSLENANKKIEGILLFINIIIYYILNTHYNFNLKRNEQINK